MIRVGVEGTGSYGVGLARHLHREGIELVRLTIPRRVYTQSHMDVVAESVIQVHENHASIRGLAFTYAPESLRFFQATFERI